MTQTVDAVYDGAVLRPETALGLEPNTRVRLTVEVLPLSKMTLVEPRDDWERKLFGAAIDCGVSVPDWALNSDGLYE